MMTEDTLTALRNRYAEPEIPKCGICGGELSIQRSGGGSPTIWACSGMIDDPTGERTWIYAEGRSMADDHYERSRWNDYRRGGDSDVIDLINAYQSLTKPASPELKLPDGWVSVPRKLTRAMSEIYHDEKCVYGSAQELHDALLDAVASAVPHTAPIEPICATGGADWVKLEDELPKDGSWCIAIEEGDFAGDVVYWGNGEWRSEFGRDEYTHWMYHPAAPET